MLRDMWAKRLFKGRESRHILWSYRRHNQGVNNGGKLDEG